MEVEQSKQWQDALARTSELRDGLGKPIDKEIIDTVVILRLLGFETVMSCGGHMDRITYGPYVMFGSEEGEKYEQKARTVGDKEGSAYRNFAEKATKARVVEKQKMLSYLEAFYKDRSVPYGRFLTMENIGLSVNQLYCLGADIAYISTKQEKRQILSADQAEMRAFTAFLKKCYFKKD